MKTPLLTNNRMMSVAASVGLSGLLAMIAISPGTLHAADATKEETGGGGLLAPLKLWQEKMSEVFRDTFQALGNSSGSAVKSSGLVSADLREQNDSYTLRLALPDRDVEKVEVTLEGDHLKVVAPEGDKVRRYEQTITLSDIPTGANLKIERKADEHRIIVRVPKAKAAAPATPKVAPDPEPKELGPVYRRDRNIMDEMDRMRLDMDRIFDDAFRSYRQLPGYTGWYDQHRFSSRYEINDEGGNYVVRVYLPAREMENVAVKVEGQTLHIDAQAEESTSKAQGKDTAGTLVHRAQYAQLVTLPGPVDALKMKVERKDQMLVVTLPKTKAS